MERAAEARETGEWLRGRSRDFCIHELRCLLRTFIELKLLYQVKRQRRESIFRRSRLGYIGFMGQECSLASACDLYFALRITSWAIYLLMFCPCRSRGEIVQLLPIT
jgi:hypothetical protein